MWKANQPTSPAPKPPYPPQPQLVVHPNNTTDRHHEFTFGVEVETVVAGLPDELDVYDALVETMMKLPESGVLEIESEKWFEYTGSNQDRSKFLIQKDTRSALYLAYPRLCTNGYG